MPVLRSRLDPAAPETRANHDGDGARSSPTCARGRRRSPGAAPAATTGRSRGTASAASCRSANGSTACSTRARAFLELSPLAATGLYDDEAPGRRDRHRHRPGRGHDLRDRRQRRDGQGRHVLPDDRQEAPPRPGDRAREPAAVHLPRRLGRRVPAAPGRGLPRPRPLRPDLLQPGADVGRRASRRSPW